jgi:protein SCO1
VRRIVIVVSMLLFAACGSETTDPAQDTTSLSGYTRDPTPSAADVQLQLAGQGTSIPVTAAAGGLRVVYFGFTSCPDVCPTTMSDLKRALLELSEAERDRVEVVMVTVDPDRDLPEKLEAYVTTFVPGGESVRFDDPAALAAAAEAFGAQYSIEIAEDGEPEVAHSAELYVVDDRGDIVLQWPFGISADAIAADLRSLLAATGSVDSEQPTPDEENT